MRVYSSNKPSTYEASGQELRIHWNMQQVSREGVEGEIERYWEANEALCNVSDGRSVLIEKIIGSVYSTGAEIATINNMTSDPDAYAEYQAFRKQAKTLADGWFNRP